VAAPKKGSDFYSDHMGTLTFLYISDCCTVEPDNNRMFTYVIVYILNLLSYVLAPLANLRAET